MVQYDPRCEDAWNDGFKEGMNSQEMSRGWTLVGLILAAFSGAIMGFGIGLIIGRLL